MNWYQQRRPIRNSMCFDLAYARDVLLRNMLAEQNRQLGCIRNECALTGGENVGGATATPAAPEVAADDDDGDGDPDPEPERRPRHRNAIPPTVEHFDRLPDSAHLDLPALKGITGKSRATLYRWIEAGLLPPPRKLGPTRNYWLVGEIRRALNVTTA